MLVRLVIDPLRVWGWHARLIAALSADGHRVEIAHAPESARRARPAGYGLLAALERIIARGPDLTYAAILTPGDLAAPSVALDAPCDLRLDLTGVAGLRAGHDLALTWDGGGEDAALLALCARDVPTLALRAAGGFVLKRARPGVERPQALTRALEHVFARAVTLGRAAPRLFAAGARDSSPLALAQGSSSFLVGAATLTARHVAERLAALLATAPRWRSGYRFVADDRVIDTLRWPAGAYAAIPDDGRRFYADPFPFTHEGVRHIFLEDYPYATGKGVISHVAIDADGSCSAPRPALEASCHLSWPMIFARDGAIWMIPETSGARRIDLYRADPFPDRWVLERTLVDDVIASDMALTEHGGRLWLLGALAEEGGSTWDGLAAFSAPHLMAEWAPHPANPLLIDAGAARPAGLTARTAAGLVRPVQDCRERYGGAMALARIDRLDETGFAQTILARLAPDPHPNAVAAHTLNAADGLETIDWME
jgi:hypothetical protein